MKKSEINMTGLAVMIMTFAFSLIVITSCEKKDDNYVYEDMGEPFNNPQYTTTQTISDASEIYAWWAGSVAADVYFCPERHGTYFGSFYLKDWPAMGNPNYTIDEQLTANAGQNFLNILTQDQLNLITGLVPVQKTSLMSLVDTREAVSIELRKFLKGSTASNVTVQTLSEIYRKYDGEIIYAYATVFSQVYQSLSGSQKNQLIGLADNLGYIDPAGAFLYSAPIAMPVVENADFLFK